MAALGTIFAFIGRIGLSLIFILSGLGKLMYQGEYNADIVANPYIASMGFGTQWALPLGVFELVAGIFIFIGFMTRFTSFVTAIYAILVALLLHNKLAGDPVQQQLFLLWFALAGGLFVLFAYGNTRSSLDSYRAAKKERANRTVVHDRVVHDEALAGEPVVVTDRTTTRHD